MEMGQMRCDVNLSLRPKGIEKFGTRSETKNVNSLRSVERAARFEIQRHAAVLSSGGTIIQETRHFHEEDGSTTSGRVKEEAEDYRYFPEPDLVPVAPAREWVEELRGTLPELPRVRRMRLREEWGISEYEMQSVLNAGAVDPIVATVNAGAPADQARKWWMGELARRANEDGSELTALPITPEQVARLCVLVAEGSLNDKLARQTIEGVLAGEGGPDEVVREARPQGRLGRGRAGYRCRRGHRREPGHRREGARRQDPGRRCPGRRRHEGHQGPGRRGPCPRDDPGEAGRRGLSPLS